MSTHELIITAKEGKQLKASGKLYIKIYALKAAKKSKPASVSAGSFNKPFSTVKMAGTKAAFEAGKGVVRVSLRSLGTFQRSVLGDAVVSVADLSSGAVVEQWFQLKNKGTTTGQMILLNCQITPPLNPPKMSEAVSILGDMGIEAAPIMASQPVAVQPVPIIAPPVVPDTATSVAAPTTAASEADISTAMADLGGIGGAPVVQAVEATPIVPVPVQPVPVPQAVPAESQSTAPVVEAKPVEPIQPATVVQPEPTTIPEAQPVAPTPVEVVVPEPEKDGSEWDSESDYSSSGSEDESECEL